MNNNYTIEYSTVDDTIYGNIVEIASIDNATYLIVNTFVIEDKELFTLSSAENTKEAELQYKRFFITFKYSHELTLIPIDAKTHEKMNKCIILADSSELTMLTPCVGLNLHD